MEIIKQSPGVLKSKSSPLVVSSGGKSRIWGVRCPFREMLHHHMADSAKRATVLRYAERNSWGAGSSSNGRKRFQQPNRDGRFTGHAMSKGRDERMDIMLGL